MLNEQRPWGGYVVLDEAADFKLKRITVKPGKRLSYQFHDRRSEHWFVVRGTAAVTLDGEILEVPAGTAIDIPRGAAHRVANETADDLVLIEVQQGDYFGEDDITRLEDDFGRAPAGAR